MGESFMYFPLRKYYFTAFYIYKPIKRTIKYCSRRNNLNFNYTDTQNSKHIDYHFRISVSKENF